MFTKEAVNAFIAQLEEWADIAESADAAPTPVAPSPQALKPKVTAAEKSLKSVPSDVLAAELQRRGWAVIQP